MSRKYRTIKFFIVSLSLFLSVLIAITNSFVLNLKGAVIDSERFLQHAAAWRDRGEFSLAIDAEFFVQFVGLLSYAGFEEFTFTLLGILLYFYSTLFILNRITIFPTFAFWLVSYLLFLSPSVLLRLGALLREPYVVFCYLFGLYFLIRNDFAGDKKSRPLTGFALMGFGSLFHKAALAALPILGAAFMFLGSGRRKARSIFLLLILSLGAFLAVGPGFFELRGASALNSVLTGDTSAAEQIVNRKASRDARATYDYGADWTSWIGISVTALKANFYFFFAPFVWEVKTVADAYLSIENLTRVFLLLCIVWSLMRLPDRQAIFLFAVYIVVTSIWALGTTNYGTGARHHYSSQPILLLVLLRISVVWERSRKASSLKT